jgi:hypothetical protein
VTAVLIELTPGPNMGYLAVVAASAGRRAGLAATAGVAVGLLSAGIASSLGLAAIVATSGLVYELLGWSGAFYLLWLAWEGWRDASAGSGKPVDTRGDKGFFSEALSPICSIRRPLFFTCRSFRPLSMMLDRCLRRAQSCSPSMLRSRPSFIRSW